LQNKQKIVLEYAVEFVFFHASIKYTFITIFMWLILLFPLLYVMNHRINSNEQRKSTVAGGLALRRDHFADQTVVLSRVICIKT